MASYKFLGQTIVCGECNSDLYFSRYMGPTNYRGIGYVGTAPTLFDGIQCVIDNKGAFPPSTATEAQRTCSFYDEDNVERFRIYVSYYDNERFTIDYYIYSETIQDLIPLTHHFADDYSARNTNLADPETRWRMGLYLAYMYNSTGCSMSEPYANEFGFVLQHDEGFYDGEGWGDFLYTGTPGLCNVAWNENGNAQSYYEPCWEFVNGYYSKESTGGGNCLFGHEVTQVVQYLMHYVSPDDPSEDPDDTAYGEEDDAPDFYDTDDDEGGYNDPFDHLPLKSAVSSGMIQAYLPTDTELRNFNNYLWSDNYATSLQKWGLKPADNIISFGVTPFDLSAYESSTTREVKMCGEGTGVQMTFMSGLCTYFEYPAGEIFLKGWTGTYLDYTHTKYYMYIPCVGIVELRACDVANRYVKLYYRGDIATGDLCAYVITRKRNSNSNEENRLYEFTGNCLYQLPLSSADFATFYQQQRHAVTNVFGAIGSGLGGMLAGASMGGIAGGIAGGILGGINSINSIWDSIESYTSAAPDVTRSGTISGSMCMLQSWQPYMIVCKQKAYRGTGQSSYYSSPVMREMKMSDCQGFTQVSKIRLNFSAQSEEKELITAILKDGILINRGGN